MNFYIRESVPQEELQSFINDLISKSYNISVSEEPESQKELFHEVLPDIKTLQRTIKRISKQGWVEINYEERESVVGGKEYLLTAWKESNVRFLVVGWRENGKIIE